MARVSVRGDRDLELDAPTLVEGLPGAGLVGKIAADHLVDTLDMAHVADVRCDGLPQVAIYRDGEPGAVPPVRLHATEEHDLLVLASDVPVSPSSAPDFAACITDWLAAHDVFPVYLSGLPEGKDGVPSVYGIGVGGGTDRLAAAEVGPPRSGGMVSGPTGALLARADDVDLPAVCLIAETEGQFPDPEAARAVLNGGIDPLADVSVDTGRLVERAEEVRAARERLATRLEDADDSSTEATPLRGFQ